jgi:hypothetical protein
VTSHEEKLVTSQEFHFFRRRGHSALKGDEAREHSGPSSRDSQRQAAVLKNDCLLRKKLRIHEEQFCQKNRQIDL